MSDPLHPERPRVPRVIATNGSASLLGYWPPQNEEPLYRVEKSNGPTRWLSASDLVWLRDALIRMELEGQA